MRIFISIDIPLEIQEKIKKIQEKLPEFKGKKTEPENLHLTLKFLGEIEENKLSLIRKKLREIKFNSFKLEINSIGVFSENFIRIIWIKINGCDFLQKKIDNCLEGLFEKEKRFMGHLTIARVKSINNKEYFLDKLKQISFETISFSCNFFSLKKSVLTEKGPVYFLLEKYPCVKN